MTSLYSIDLRPSEITLLRRALAGDAKFHQELMVNSKPQWEKEDMKKRMEAAERLSERLMKDARPADTVGPALFNRVIEELRTMEQTPIADWESATEALVNIIKKGMIKGEQT
mgnify:CR=1 FL=1